jgi:hypothetical protein
MSGIGPEVKRFKGLIVEEESVPPSPPINMLNTLIWFDLVDLLAVRP